MVIDRCRGETETNQGEDGELGRLYLMVRQHWVFKFHFSKFTFGTVLLRILQKTLVKSKLVLRLLHCSKTYCIAHSHLADLGTPP